MSWSVYNLNKVNTVNRVLGIYSATTINKIPVYCIALSPQDRANLIIKLLIQMFLLTVTNLEIHKNLLCLFNKTKKKTMNLVRAQTKTTLIQCWCWYWCWNKKLFIKWIFVTYCRYCWTENLHNKHKLYNL